MKFKVLITGSESNCSLLTYKNTNILIDCGFKTNKRMKEILENVLDTTKIDGIIITHEHGDHFSPWTGRLCMEYGIKLYVHQRHIEDEENRKTKYLSFSNKKTKEDFVVDYEIIEEGKPFYIKDLKIEGFNAYHDAKKTLGYIFNDDEFGYLADCGYISSKIKNKLLPVKNLALEFNYEIKELLNSNRHWVNKLRTMKKFGHLSNEEAFKFANWLKEKGNLEYLITLHPSSEHCDLNKLQEKLSELKIKYSVSKKENNETIIFANKIKENEKVG